MAISLVPHASSVGSGEVPRGSSHFWGFPDLQADIAYPVRRLADGDEDPLTFVCQLRCEELAPLDARGLLPHMGLLSFFAAVDEYLGMEPADAACHAGIGEWASEAFRVIWSPDLTRLETHTILDADGAPYGLPAEPITFAPAEAGAYGHKVLGRPAYDEVAEQAGAGLLNLLQLDEEERWGRRFYDCGMLHFLIREEDLRARAWERVRCYMHSF